MAAKDVKFSTEARERMDGDSFCAYCSRMKRGIMYSTCRQESYNVLVLAQHLDDLAESLEGMLARSLAGLVVSASELDASVPGLFDGVDIPVVIFTAREHTRGRKLAREMGAVDYFQKPFEPDELIEIVEQYLSRENVEVR